MNALAKITPMLSPAPTRLSRRQVRAQRSIGHQPLYDSLDVEMTGHLDCGTSMRVEVEFFQSLPAFPQSEDDPGAPAEYEITRVRAYDLASGTVNGRVYLETPEWLEEALIDCINVDRLEDRA